MTDIVQLKENGVAKYLKTHVRAVEGLDETLTARNSVVLWTGDAKVGDLLTLSQSVANFNILTMVIEYSGNRSNASFLPTDLTCSGVCLNLLNNSTSTTISVMELSIQKNSDTQYVVNYAKEVSGSNLGEGSKVTGALKMIIGSM